GILPHLSFVPVRARPASADGSPRTTGTMPALGAGGGGTPAGGAGQGHLDAPLALAVEGRGRANFMQGGAMPAPAPVPVRKEADQAAAKPGGALGTGFAALQSLLKRRRV